MPLVPATLGGCGKVDLLVAVDPASPRAAAPPPPAPPAPPPRHRTAVAALLLAGAGALLGYFGARYAAVLFVPARGGVGYKLTLLASVPLLWLLVVGIHELGHLVGGWLTGGRFLLFIVGPFQWRRTPAGVRFAWNRSLNLAGGLASCLPADDRDLPRRIAGMIVAGPLASALLAVAAGWMSAWAAAAGIHVAQHLAMIVALLSAMIFVVTALPGEVGGFKTDGRRFFALVRGDARSAQEAALLSLTVSGLGGTRPADYDPAVVAAATSPDDGSLNAIYGHFSAFSHQADRGDLAAAQAHLDRVIAGEARLPPFMRSLARAEYAWLLATAPADPAVVTRARAWLASAGRNDFDPATTLRADAAVLLAEGRAAEAAAQARAGLHALENHSLAPVKNRFAADQLAALLARATLAASLAAGNSGTRPLSA